MTLAKLHIQPNTQFCPKNVGKMRVFIFEQMAPNILSVICIVIISLLTIELDRFKIFGFEPAQLMSFVIMQNSNSGLCCLI